MDTLALELASDLGAPVPGRADAGGLAALRTNNLEAYRDYSVGLEMANGLHNTEAVALFQKAVTLDPRFAMAQARIGYTLATGCQIPVAITAGGVVANVANIAISTGGPCQ